MPVCTLVSGSGSGEGTVHMSVDDHRGQRLWLVLQLEVQVVVSLQM